MTRQIIVERSDWFIVDAADAKFEYIGPEEKTETISGEAWLSLDNDGKSNYALMTSEAEEDSIDGGMEEFSVGEYVDRYDGDVENVEFSDIQPNYA